MNVNYELREKDWHIYVISLLVSHKKRDDFQVISLFHNDIINIEHKTKEAITGHIRLQCWYDAFRYDDKSKIRFDISSSPLFIAVSDVINKYNIDKELILKLIDGCHKNIEQLEQGDFCSLFADYQALQAYWQDVFAGYLQITATILLADNSGLGKQEANSKINDIVAELSELYGIIELCEYYVSGDADIFSLASFIENNSDFQPEEAQINHQQANIIKFDFEELKKLYLQDVKIDAEKQQQLERMLTIMISKINHLSGSILAKRAMIKKDCPSLLILFAFHLSVIYRCRSLFDYKKPYNFKFLINLLLKHFVTNY